MMITYSVMTLIPWGVMTLIPWGVIKNCVITLNTKISIVLAVMIGNVLLCSKTCAYTCPTITIH